MKLAKFVLIMSLVFTSISSYANPLVVAGAKKAVSKALKQKGLSRAARLKELLNDPKVGRSEKGWIKQELNALKRSAATLKRRYHIRNPPQLDLAHLPGREASKGFSYAQALLRPRSLHRARHKIDNYGRKNKIRVLLPHELHRK